MDDGSWSIVDEVRHDESMMILAEQTALPSLFVEGTKVVFVCLRLFAFNVHLGGCYLSVVPTDYGMHHDHTPTQTLRNAIDWFN